MSFKDRIAKYFASDLIEREVAEAVQRARASLPITANYDPEGEGYRRLTGTGSGQRDLHALSQDRMFEIAYFMWDTSAMVKGMASMDKSFLFAEPVTVTSDDEMVQEVIDRFWNDPVNAMNLRFPERMMWMSLLGEQLWQVRVNKNNGHVRLNYIDPSNIKEVYVNRLYQSEPVRIELMGRAGGKGKMLNVIRDDRSVYSKSYGKLTGDCFFFTINKPENAARGRSDFLTLFDWIDGLERYGFNYLERAEHLLNYVWDVTLNGFNEDQIRSWLQNNPIPQPGSMRAHNENVAWNAVAPDLKAQDARAGYDMGKSFIMGAARRPEGWFGGGGKAYQTEAEQFGQVPIKDLSERQLLIKYIAHYQVQFAIDQAIIAGRLPEKRAEAGFVVQMPEISTSDYTSMMNGVPQVTTALTVAEQNGWVSRETATRLFAFICGQMGFEVDAEAEMEQARDRPEEGTEDYIKKGGEHDREKEE
jgi:hypothetical protein